MPYQNYLELLNQHRQQMRMLFDWMTPNGAAKMPDFIEGLYLTEARLVKKAKEQEILREFERAYQYQASQ